MSSIHARTRSALLLLVLLTPPSALAQDPEPPPAPEHEHAAHAPAALMAPRDASGTAWLPDQSPMHAVHRQAGPWSLMLHGVAFVQYLNEGGAGPRSVNQAGSINWVMLMARRAAGSGRLGLRAMASAEPWTIPGCGYPNLLATGERCDGAAIHDRQHQHDLFMELAADYDRPLAGNVRWQVYGGVSGEPALGPVAFPHRPSSAGNPIAPIAHHWLDATHIVFGVVTTGVSTRRWKIEGSAFNGREPDEDRTDLDLARLDSFSSRVTWLPTDRWSLQASAGRLRDAEPDHEGVGAVDVTRVTASATYHRPMADGGLWATTAAWGRNAEAGDASHFGLVESSASLGSRDVIYGRLEVGGKSAHDLDVPDALGVVTIGKVQGGYTRYAAPRRGLQPGMGAMLTVALTPRSLRPFYRAASVGGGVFLTVRLTS